MKTVLVEIAKTIVAGGVYAVIFIAGEAVRRALPANPEIARKSVHFASGIVALSFPYLFSSHWQVLSLALGSIALLLAARNTGMLQSIYSTRRKSYGDYLFPTVIYLLFVLAGERVMLYLIPVLVMTVADTLAALSGSRYGSVQYEVELDRKSLEGSVVFFFTTFLCIHLLLLLLTETGRLDSVVIALVIAILITGLEAVSVIGSDNFFVPFGTYFMLAKMSRHTTAENIEQLLLLLAMIVLTVIIYCKGRIFKASGLLGVIILNYSAWSLGDFSWFLPLLLAEVMVFALVAYFTGRTSQVITGYQIKILLYAAIVPVLLLFAANASGRYQLLYLPYLVSVVAQIAIIFYYFIAIACERSSLLIDRLQRTRPAACLFCATAMTIWVAGLPLMLSEATISIPKALAVIWTGASIAVCSFHLQSKKYRLEEERNLRQQMRLVNAGMAAIFVFLLQMLGACG